MKMGNIVNQKIKTPRVQHYLRIQLAKKIVNNKIKALKNCPEMSHHQKMQEVRKLLEKLPQDLVQASSLQKLPPKLPEILPLKPTPHNQDIKKTLLNGEPVLDLGIPTTEKRFDGVGRNNLQGEAADNHQIDKKKYAIALVKRILQLKNPEDLQRILHYVSVLNIAQQCYGKNQRQGTANIFQMRNVTHPPARISAKRKSSTCFYFGSAPKVPRTVTPFGMYT